MEKKLKHTVFDIEANGLLDTVTKIWVIACVDTDGRNQKIFTDLNVFDYKKDGKLVDGVMYLQSRDLIIAHNLMGYDYVLLEKFYPKLWNKKTVPFSKCWDTFIQSKTQHFQRPRIKGVKGNHGLEYYGILFKYPKPPIEDWSYWDEAKLERVLVDIEINCKTYHYLNNQAQEAGLDFTTQIRRSQVAQYWYTHQELHGTYADVELMEQSVKELDEQIEELRAEIEPQLPAVIKPKGVKCTWQEVRDKWDKFYRKVPKVRYDDKTGKIIKEAIMPVTKWRVASGDYDRHTLNHFKEWLERYPDSVVGEHTRIEISSDTKLSQHAIVKEFLLSLGWKPTQWNYEKDANGKFMRDAGGDLIKKSPKLTEDSFDSIQGEVGQKIALYNTLVHRRRTILNEKSDEKGWLNQIREDGRISSGCMAWATETGRGAQKGIVNVPSTAAVYGENMRKVWTVPEDKVMISVDMDSAQLRLLANFMGDPIYTEAVLNGMEFDDQHNYVGTDPHTANAIAFGVMNPDMVEEARQTQDKKLIDELSYIRKYSKNGIYAYLFGAGDAKLATTLKMRTAADGKRIKESFAEKLPAMAALQSRLKRQWKENSYKNGGYIEVAGNTWVWCGSEHKLLNYLLMGSEGVLQNQAICWVNRQMEVRRLGGNQLLSIHDELTFEFPLEEEKQGIQLLTEMYGRASELIGLEVLVTGTAQSGRNWAEIH